MTDHMVHAGTDGLRERHLAATAAIIERGGDAIEFTDDVVVTNLVEFFGGDTWLYMLTDHFQYRGSCAACGSHAL